MYKQNQEAYTAMFSKINKYILFPVLILSGFFLISCRNSIEEIKALTPDLNLPDQSGKDIEVQYTDSAKLLLKFKTPLMKRYLNKEEGPYYEFPDGIDVIFYDKSERLQSQVTAKYAIYHDKTQIWDVRNDVVAKNLQSGEQLNTEELFWDMGKKQIYSNVFTKITNADGVYFGENGFESNQDFTNYKLIGSRGSVNVRDEQIK
jgi:LPS export ABC transporter protein LptC